MPTQIKRKKIIVGNWKTAPATAEEAVSLFSELNGLLSDKSPKNTEIIICPPSLYLGYLSNPESKKQKLKIGMQNIYAGQKEMCTGEISALMAKKAGASHVIVGHSERRGWEGDEAIAAKAAAVLAAKMTPIICVGEEARDEEGQYLQAIADQLTKRLSGIPKSSLSSIVIAYEPIWAIGAAAAMSAEDVHQMSIFIQKTLVNHYKMKPPVSTPILYGGSVDPANAHGILTQGNVDGLLIGRQSLIPENFFSIISHI